MSDTMIGLSQDELDRKARRAVEARVLEQEFLESTLREFDSAQGKHDFAIRLNEIKQDVPSLDSQAEDGETVLQRFLPEAAAAANDLRAGTIRLVSLASIAGALLFAEVWVLFKTNLDQAGVDTERDTGADPLALWLAWTMAMATAFALTVGSRALLDQIAGQTPRKSIGPLVRAALIVVLISVFAAKQRADTLGTSILANLFSISLLPLLTAVFERRITGGQGIKGCLKAWWATKGELRTAGGKCRAARETIRSVTRKREPLAKEFAALEKHQEEQKLVAAAAVIAYRCAAKAAAERVPRLPSAEIARDRARRFPTRPTSADSPASPLENAGLTPPRAHGNGHLKTSWFRWFGPGGEVQMVVAFVCLAGSLAAAPVQAQATPPVRGIHLTGWAAGSKKFEQLIRLPNETPVNAFVIEVKDDRGQVSYLSRVKVAAEIGASVRKVRDVADRLRQLRSHRIYAIARIVVTKDPLAAAGKRGWAIQTASGRVWRDGAGLAWVDPCVRGVWSYAADLAEEALRIGFDEVQFDYVRFPESGDLRGMRHQCPRGESRSQTIERQVDFLRRRLAPLKKPVTFAVFGLTTGAKIDFGIGQVWEFFSAGSAAVLPMVYPSHYAPGSYGVADPNARPYRVVRAALEQAVVRNRRIARPARIRPYLQAFGFGNTRYGACEVQAQIRAARDAGINEWVLWNPRGDYRSAWFKSGAPCRPYPTPEATVRRGATGQ